MSLGVSSSLGYVGLEGGQNWCQNGAAGENRTHCDSQSRWVYNPVRIPNPGPPHKIYSAGVEPVHAYQAWHNHLVGRCSVSGGQECQSSGGTGSLGQHPSSRPPCAFTRQYEVPVATGTLVSRRHKAELSQHFFGTLGFEMMTRAKGPRYHGQARKNYWEIVEFLERPFGGAR